MVQRAVLLVKGRPDQDEAGEIAWRVAVNYGDDDVEVVGWEFVQELPTWFSVALRDQLMAHKRDTEGETNFMVVYMGTQEEFNINE